MTCRSFEGQRKGGRGGGNGKGRSTSLGAKEKRGTRRECHVACSPPRYSLSLSLSWAFYVGRQEWRQEAAPPPSFLHPLLPPFSSSLTPHVFPASPPPFPLPYFTSLRTSPLCLLRAKFLFVGCIFSFHPSSFTFSVFLTHRRVCAS